MSFVMIATGATSHSRIRTLSIRYLLLGGAASALLLLAAGGSLGYWLAAPLPAQHTAAPVPVPVPVPVRAHAALPFTLDQLGAISGRLFRLESQAAQMSKRIGVFQKDEVLVPERKAGSGGPMLPPRPVSATDDLDTLGAQLARLELQIGLVSDAMAQRNLDVMRAPTRLPIAGAAMVSAFGNRHDPFTDHRAFHAGLDFAAQHGTPIHSAGGGKVVFAGFRPDYGWLVEIEHGNGLTTRYAHASKLLVTQGAVVAPGERIAMVGSTGRSTGPHLHFEVLRHGGHIDPRHFLASR